MLFSLCILCMFLLNVYSFSLASFLFILSPFYGCVGYGAILLCYLFCLVSFSVLLVRYFTSLTPMGCVLLFGIAFLRILFFSFRLSVYPFHRGAVCCPVFGHLKRKLNFSGALLNSR